MFFLSFISGTRVDFLTAVMSILAGYKNSHHVYDPTYRI